MRYQKFLTRLFVFLGLCALTLFPWGLNQARAQTGEPYEPSSILVTELGETVPPGRLNIRFPPRNPTQVSHEIQQLLQQPLSTLSEVNISAQNVPVITPEIQELAKGLENDPLAIYDYVHNHIDFIPSWGLLKNPRETLLAGVGNPFDQAALLSALLQAAGFQTRYVFGDIEIDKPTAINWVGAKDPDVVGNVFASGGTPTTLLLNGNLELSHIWVEICDGGTGAGCAGGSWRPLDPSFKSYNEQAGQNLRPLMGFNLSAFVNNAQNGATITANFIQNPNETNIRNNLAGYASNLVDFLRSNNTFMYPEELIGSREIVPIETNSFPTLPYQVVSTSGTAVDIPDSLSYKLNIQLLGINYTTNIDDIAGERITIFFECATTNDCNTLNNGGGVYNLEPPTLVNVVPKLRVGGVVVATGSSVLLGTWGHQLSVTITTPFGSSFPFNRSLVAGEWYALPLRLQIVSDRAFARQVDLLNEAIAQGITADDERVLGQILYVQGLSYFNEVDLGDRIDTRLAKVVHIPHFSMMVASRDLSIFVDASNNPVALDPGSHSVDVKLSLDSAISAQNPANANRERAWNVSVGIRSSATEHAIHEQLLSVTALSTIQILNAAAQGGQRVYYVTPSNAGTVLPALNHDPSVLNSIINDLSAGKHVVISQNEVTIDQWTGSGWISLDPSNGIAGYLISGNLGSETTAPLIMNGGSTTSPVPPQLSILVAVRVIRESNNISEQTRKSTRDERRRKIEEIPGKKPDPTGGGDPGNPDDLSPIGDPINVTTGSFVYHHIDLASLGGLGIPLKFERFYLSSKRNQVSALGRGWSHTYNMRFYVGSDWLRALGGRTALEAAPALAAAQVGIDLFDAANIPHQRYTIDVIAAQWLMTQIIGNAAVLVEPDGNTAAHVRLADGTYQPPAGSDNLISVAAPGDGSGTLVWEDGRRMVFNTGGRPTTLQDANNNRTTLNYDGQGRLSQVKDAVGRRLTFNYVGQGRLSQVTDQAGGRNFGYTYDGQGNLQTYTDPSGVTTYHYDAGHRITTIKDPTNTTFVTNQYDTLGRVMNQTNGRGFQTGLLYGGDHTIVIDPLDNRTTYAYDDRNRLLDIENALGHHRTFIYDAADQVTSRKNGLNQTTTFAYDNRGRLTTTTDPLGYTTTFAYDAAGNPVSYSDQRGHTWQFAYNGQHNLTNITNPLGGTTTYTYDGKGRLTKAQDATERSATYTYDGYGNVGCVMSALGQGCWGYDNVGRPTSYTDGTSNITQFSYDSLDNLIQVTDLLGNQTGYTYDGNNNLTGVTDANSHTTTFAYDAQFNLTSVTDPLGKVTSYNYDANDNLVRVTDANDHQTNYGRDVLGRLSTITDPSARTITFHFDATDRVIGFDRADGSSISYQRDPLGRLTTIDYPSGPDISYGYDAAGNLTAAAYGGSWNATYSYDSLNRLQTTQDKTRNLTLSYEYDLANRRTRLLVTSNSTLYDAIYSYDDASLLSSVVDQISNSTINLSYDANGRLINRTDPGGAQANFTYDQVGRLMSVDHKDAQGNNIATYTYSYDHIGNPISVKETTPTGSFDITYEYDALDRLIKEIYPRHNISFTYDDVGNLKSRTDPLGTLNYVYDDANQLLSRGSETFSHDLNGNMISRQNSLGTYTYTFNAENILTNLTLPDNSTVTFTHDAFGRRLTMQSGVETRGFFYDGLNILLKGNNDLSTTTARYLYQHDSLLARHTSQLGFTSYRGDALENTRYLLDTTGLELDSYQYEAFGQAAQPTGVDPNLFRFLGQRGVLQSDIPEQPLSLTGYREFDFGNGRFLTRDPLSSDLFQPQTLNDYIYSLGNPIRFGDPTGLRPEREKDKARSNIVSRLFAFGRRVAFQIAETFAQREQVPGLRPKLEKGRVDGPNGLLNVLLDRPDFIIFYAQASDQLLLPQFPNQRLVSSTRIESFPPNIIGFSGGDRDFKISGIVAQDSTQLKWQPIASHGTTHSLTCTSGDHLLGGAFQDGIFGSNDTGHATWNMLHLARAGEIVTANDNTTYYAGAWQNGALKSINSGTSWTAINNGLAANDVYALAINPTMSSQIFAGTEMGLFISNNGGNSWKRPGNLPPGKIVSDLAFAGNTLLAITDFGLYRSTNSGGNPWQKPTADLPMVRVNMLQVISPTSTVYAGTVLGLYQSADSGDTWSAVAGLTNQDVQALAIDPIDANHLAAGTTSGLFISVDGGNTWAIESHAGLNGPASQIGAVAFCPDGGDNNLYVGAGGGIYALREAVEQVYLPIVLK